MKNTKIGAISIFSGFSQHNTSLSCRDVGDYFSNESKETFPFYTRILHYSHVNHSSRERVDSLWHRDSTVASTSLKRWASRKLQRESPVHSRFHISTRLHRIIACVSLEYPHDNALTPATGCMTAPYFSGSNSAAVNQPSALPPLAVWRE